MDTIDELLAAFSGMRATEVHFPLREDADANVRRVDLLSELLLRRVVELGEGARAELVANRPLSALVLVRALGETVGLAGSLVEKLELAVKSGRSKRDPALESFLMKVLFGSRTEVKEQGQMTRSVVEEMLRAAGIESGVLDNLRSIASDCELDEVGQQLGEAFAGYSSPNVLTSIDVVKKRYPRFREAYDLLSEVAHPNSAGLFDIYVAQVADGNGLVHLETDENGRYKKLAVGSLSCFLVVYLQLKKSIQDLGGRLSASLM